MKFSGKKVAVLGLGIEGKDSITYLLKNGAEVTLFDKKKVSDLNFDSLDAKDIRIVSGEDYLEKGIVGFDFIVRSPGFRPDTPEILRAQEQGAKITSATKMFFEECPGKIVGVTGTKGKGTTSTLIYEILKKAGRDVYLVGNIGRPFLEILPKLNKNSWIVMELSSFQLMDLDISPHLAVVLNVTVDHLDWHLNEEEYVQSKSNIVRYQKESDFAVFNFDYAISKHFAEFTKAKKYFFSRKEQVVGSYVLDRSIKLRLDADGAPVEIGDTKDLLLRGEHNWENITAAICATSLIGAEIEDIKKIVFSFKGLEHRLEVVAEVEGRTFYNDSFATGPQPTIAAINSFTEPETLILGGSDKGLDYSILGEEVAKRSNLKNIILIGSIGKKIGEAIIKANFKGNIENLGMADMNQVVKRAIEITEPGDVIILSPAAASFDMFKNYKDRGNKFKEAVISFKNG